MATVINNETALLGYMTGNGTAYLDRICVYEYTEPSGVPVYTLLDTVQTLVWDSEGLATTDYTFTIASGKTVSGVMLFDSNIGILNTNHIMRFSLDAPVYLANGGQFIVQSTSLSF